MNKKMPVVFVGHGSPMNAIEKNHFTEEMAEIGARIGKPKAILAVSAHWLTEGIKVSTASENRQIYDMYGFPQELYEVKYAPKGDPLLAMHTLSYLKDLAKADESWGIDHGVWSVLVRMYQKADIPVVMMSVDPTAPAENQFFAGVRLKPLREEGVLILASGNVVHNLAACDFRMENEGYPWAQQFDRTVKENILNHAFERVAELTKGPDYRNATGIGEHFYPLLTALGAAGQDARAEVWNEACIIGALSMTSYLFT